MKHGMGSEMYKLGYLKLVDFIKQGLTYLVWQKSLTAVNWVANSAKIHGHVTVTEQ